MKLGLYIGCLVLVLTSCSYMQDVVLYQPAGPAPDPLESFEFKEIFSDSQSNKLYGVKTSDCKQVSFESGNSFFGDDHLRIAWDKSNGCNYVGVGFSWGNYKSKDLSAIVESAAIEMRIRAHSGQFTKVPMIVGLVDYGGRQCLTGINYLNIEGGLIDTSWTRIRIPLQAFKHEKKGVNISNIKELKIEFQRSGDLHIDALRIVPHDHDFGYGSSQSSSEITILPYTPGSGKDYWWGVGKDYPSPFEFSSDSSLNYHSSSEEHTGVQSTSIRAAVDMQANLGWTTFGFPFDEWKRVDVSSVFSSSAIRFRVKADSFPKIQMILHSYSGQRRKVQKLVPETFAQEIHDGLYEVWVPIRSFTNYDLLNSTTLKEVRINVLENAKFVIGDFELVEFRGNPNNPVRWFSK